jgi:hypothetical protein
MFNPFKKKESEFKLDELELPSISENKEEPINSPETNTLNEAPITENDPTKMPQENFPINNEPSPQFPNPFVNNAQTQDTSQSNPHMQNMHNDITKAKLDSMESKVTLIDARLSSIEQKLELLNKLILEEVSDETKRKLKVQSMMSNIKE